MTLFFRNLFKNISKDIGLDLGTANTLVYVRGRGIVLSEPTVVAIQKSDGKVRWVGKEAKLMLGRTPGDIQTIRPLRNGVIADFEVTEAMITHFVRKVHHRSRLVYPHMVIGIPCGSTEVERRAVKSAAEKAGARQPEIVEEPLAAAVGAGLPVTEPMGSMIVDIGAGTTEAAVVSLGGICNFQTLRIGGDEMDEAIIAYLRREQGILIGERSAEELKKEIGSAYPLEQELTGEVRGRHLLSGLPRTVVVGSEQVREAIAEPLQSIVEMVRDTIEATAPELAADIVRNGVCLCGGGALVRGIDKLIWSALNVPVYVAKDPMTCVVMGTGKFLEQTEGKREIRGGLTTW